MSTYKQKNCDRIIILGVIFGLFAPIICGPTTVLPTAVVDESSSEESSESDSSRSERDVSDEIPPIITTPPSVVLKPNVTGALDVGQGLLVPLVPVVDPNSDNHTTQVSPLVANLVPVAIESVTPSETTDEPKPEITRSLEEMDVAEDIVFRPLFRYRQEEREKYARNRYYQPYIYAYKNPRYRYYQNDYNI